jgi:Ca2+-binding RTX toxin-like protein
MTNSINSDVFHFFGTNENDALVDGLTNVEGNRLTEASENVVKANGLEGDDTITTTLANDLAAGDMVGDEWSYVNGVWTYDASAVVVSSYGRDKSYDDVITTGQGNDVLLGNGGNDQLFAGYGNDIVNAGTGHDIAFGGYGDDIINLEDGNDYVEGGFGDDIVNAGDGDDVVYGDVKADNLLAEIASGASTFDDLSETGTWTMDDTFGESTISQSVNTVAGETYTIGFGLAANLAGGHSTGLVEVMWNGVVVDTVEANSGAYEKFEIDVVSTGTEGVLSFNALDPEPNEQYNFDGPIISYDKEMVIGGENVSVEAFAPGQANLYQVIDGQLNVFNVQTNEYIAVGEQPDFKINAVGFNVEDDLIYGVAKSSGTDSLGNTVNTTDIVMIDAEGSTFRIGEGYYGDYVGDFDNSGNLWTFHSALNRVSVVDVDQLDANGNPAIEHYKFPASMFDDRTYDLAFNAEDGNFYAVVSPDSNGQAGKVVKIDMSTVKDGGAPTFAEVSITGTLYGDTMELGMAKGAYGAVFLDGEGNLYFGLNNGDHDLDGSTDVDGAIFKVNVDWENGQAYAEFMAEAPATGSNDGAVDPRSSDTFSEIDADAAVLIQEPTLTLVDGGNDILRGGAGDDEMHGNNGNDDLNGGTGDDFLFGDQGNDNISGGAGNDWAAGGTGDDKLRGESGNDELFGNDGKDYMNGGSGDDQLSGGNGVDKIVGGVGSDVINGGAGNDNLWGGNWSGDATDDTFVFESGTGKDYVHDYETGVDMIDLSSFDTSLAEVQGATTDLGWATVIDLQQLDGGQAGDKIVLKSVEADDLSYTDFIF